MIVADAPAATVRVWRNAALVPAWAGLVVGVPAVTVSPIPSLGNGVADGVPYRRSVLVSLSQNSGSGAPELVRRRPPNSGCSAASAPSWRVIAGRAGSVPHDHVLRNHSVGRTSIVAGSGPALRTVIRISRSSAVALA